MSLPIDQMGDAQEVSRRVNGFSNFAIGFSLICILAGGITSFQVGYGPGGAFTATIGWIAGACFALIAGCRDVLTDQILRPAALAGRGKPLCRTGCDLIFCWHYDGEPFRRCVDGIGRVPS